MPSQLIEVLATSVAALGLLLVAILAIGRIIGTLDERREDDE